MVEIISVGTPSLGDRSYLAHNGEVALVVDAQRDIDRMLGLAARLQVRITHVLSLRRVMWVDRRGGRGRLA
jgi:hydroxyacylglutathione hydrolase